MVEGRRMLLYAAIGSAVAILAVVSIGYPWLLGLQGANNSAPDSELKIAVLTDANFSDEGWGESSLQAARYIEQKYNTSVATEDNVAIPDIETTLVRYADSGYNLIIAHGVQWGEPALQVAKGHPQTKIVVFTGLVQSDNVASIFPQQQQGSFILGALAGMMTRTGTIGFVGGEEYPNVVNIYEGYKEGARWANANVSVIGTYLNDWDNPARGKEAATSIIRQDADIVFHVADTSGHGVIQSANENGVYALGAVQDQNHLDADTVLCSFVLDVDKAYDNAVRMVKEGNFRGEIFRPGIELQRGSDGEGVVYLAPFHGLESNVPEGVKDRIEQLANEMLDGRMQIPERIM
jgi:basic membrane protein A